MLKLVVRKVTGRLYKVKMSILQHPTLHIIKTSIQCHEDYIDTELMTSSLVGYKPHPSAKLLAAK